MRRSNEGKPGTGKGRFEEEQQVQGARADA